MVLRKIEVNEEKPLFRLFILKDDEGWSVDVVEVEDIDVRKVKKNLEQGDSVFITLKREKNLKTGQVEREDVAEPWYFTRV